MAQSRLVDDTTRRRIRECCTQLHSCLLTWRDAQSTGLKSATSIVNSRIQHDGIPLTANLELGKCLSDMDGVLRVISSLTSNMHAILRLAAARAKLDVQLLEQPLFHTLSSAQFVDHYERILAAYSQQASLFRSIVAELGASSAKRDTMMFYLSAWRHEPYVDESIRVLVEALLVEMDLR